MFILQIKIKLTIIHSTYTLHTYEERSQKMSKQYFRQLYKMIYNNILNTYIGHAVLFTP